MRKRDNEIMRKVSENLNGLDYSAGSIQRLETARHESGHLIAAIILGETIIGISLGSKGLGGAFSCSHPKGRDVESLRCRMVTVWAGCIAEGRELHADGSGELGDDADKLKTIAREICGAAAKSERIDAEIRKAKIKAERLVKRHRPAIEQLANKLLDLYRVIDGIKK